MVPHVTRGFYLPASPSFQLFISYFLPRAFTQFATSPTPLPSMVRTTTGSIRPRKSSPKASAAEAQVSTERQNAPGQITLDQNEVLKAMMAARKGKARDMSPSDDEDESESGSEEDSEGEESQGDDNSASDSEEDNASVASSSSGPRRGVKRSRSGSALSRSLSPRPATLPSRIPDTSSRVKLAAQTAPAKAKSSNPFDTPKVKDATFAGLGLSQPLIRALATINISKPTEIQSACVGPIMDGELGPSPKLELTIRTRLHWRCKDR